MRQRTRTLSCIALILGTAGMTGLTAACQKAPEEAAAPEATSAPEAPIAPQSSRGPVAEAASTASGEAGIAFDLPAGWQKEPPSSSMRLAQAAIPGAAGAGQLVVFYFGPGGGGGVEDNLQRWIDQIAAEGRSEPQRGTLQANGLQVTWLDVSGTLMPSGMGTGPTEPVPGSRLLGAVVEGPGGPWFFKATGPAATLAEQREGFLQVLRSARPTSQV